MFRQPCKAKIPQNCWFKLPLDSPFQYNLNLQIGEDTTSRRALVIEYIVDVDTPQFDFIMRYNPTAGTSYFTMRRYQIRSSTPYLVKDRIHEKWGICSPVCNSITELDTTMWKSTLMPVICFDFAPNSIRSEPATSIGGIYPNPLESDGQLYFKPALQGQPYRLYNLQGALLREGNANKEGIDMSTLPAGMYILHCGKERYKVAK